ncbi:MAG: hypothetical protein QG655_3235 [Actinomycetota bacterium]|jgi:transcriptional regulator with XRE-family HTH domain|nr:helix-turn-helix domain-containing protein [Gemmatimonadales bacterium]MDQ1321990.1 hypothetical protein [Actinomycetota bacterium]
MQQTNLAANIRAELARNGKTQSDLADHLGITRQALSQRLLGRVDFRMGEVTATASFLSTSISALVGEVAA